MRDGHHFVNTGWNCFICTHCKLEDWTTEGTGPCRGRLSYACPLQSNGFTHGECGDLFDSQADAQAHWKQLHQGVLERKRAERSLVVGLASR